MIHIIFFTQSWRSSTATHCWWSAIHWHLVEVDVTQWNFSLVWIGNAGLNRNSHGCWWIAWDFSFNRFRFFYQCSSSRPAAAIISAAGQSWSGFASESADLKLKECFIGKSVLKKLLYHFCCLHLIRWQYVKYECSHCFLSEENNGQEPTADDFLVIH